MEKIKHKIKKYLISKNIYVERLIMRDYIAYPFSVTYTPCGNNNFLLIVGIYKNFYSISNI